MTSLDLTDPEVIESAATEIKRMLEKEFNLPTGAADQVNNDILRLLVWRDRKEDPGPLTGVQRELYAQKYFNLIFSRKKANGELIFKTAKDARELLLNHGFKHLGGGKFERGVLLARIMKTNLIHRVVVQNQETRETIDNEGKL